MHPLSSASASTGSSPTSVRQAAAASRDGASVRTRALAAAAQARLRPVCVGWPPEQFAALIADVVRFRERWDARPYPSTRG